MTEDKRTFPSIPIPQSAAWIMLTSFPPSPAEHRKREQSKGLHTELFLTSRGRVRTPSDTDTTNRLPDLEHNCAHHLHDSACEMQGSERKATGTRAGTSLERTHRWHRCVCVCAVAAASRCEPSGWVSSGSTRQQGTGRPAPRARARSTAGTPATQTHSHRQPLRAQRPPPNARAGLALCGGR